MDAVTENSDVTVKPHAKSDQLYRSTETICSESSEDFQSKCKNAANLLQKRKQGHPFLADGDGSPYRSVNFFATRAFSCTRLFKRNSMSGCSEKIMAEKVLQIKQLQNELSEARFQINELANENRLLLNIQKRQAVALRKYEGKKAELPQLMHSHNEEVRVLKSKLKELRVENLEKDQHLKGLHAELLNLKEKHRHLLKLARDRRLKEREQLTKQVEDLQEIIKEQDIKIKTLTRKGMLESKTYKHQLAVEISHHKETRKTLEEALEKIAKLERMLETKERCIANLSPKRTLPKYYQQHALSLASWNTKTPRFSTHKINHSETDYIENQNPAVEEASSEVTYTASQTTTSFGSTNNSLLNIQGNKENIITAEAKYQARRLRLANKINRIKEKLTNKHLENDSQYNNDENANTYSSDEEDTDTLYDDKTLNSDTEAVSRRTSQGSFSVRYVDSKNELQIAADNLNNLAHKHNVDNMGSKMNEMPTKYEKNEIAVIHSLIPDDQELSYRNSRNESLENNESNTDISNESSQNKNFEHLNLSENFANDSLSSAEEEQKMEGLVSEEDHSKREILECEGKTVAENAPEDCTTNIPNYSNSKDTLESSCVQKNKNKVMDQNNSHVSEQHGNNVIEPEVEVLNETETKDIHLSRHSTESTRSSLDDVLPKINKLSDHSSHFNSCNSSKYNQEKLKYENRQEEILPDCVSPSYSSTYNYSKLRSSLHNLAETSELLVSPKHAGSSEQNIEKFSILKREKEMQNQNHSNILNQDPAKKSKLLEALKAIDDGKDPETEYDIHSFEKTAKVKKNINGNELLTLSNNAHHEMEAKPLSSYENITFPSIDNNGSRRFSTISYWEHHQRYKDGNKRSTTKDELLRELFGKHETEQKIKVKNSCSSEGKDLLLDVLKPSQNLLEKN